jgi:hypothetical protein
MHQSQELLQVCLSVKEALRSVTYSLLMIAYYFAEPPWLSVMPPLYIGHL